MNENLNIETAEETIERPYTLRRLKDGDLFVVLDIISKIFPDELSSFVMQIASGEKSVRDLGIGIVTKLIITVVKNIGKVHDELYSWLSDVSGIPAKDIEEMEFGTTPMMLWDIVNNEKNASFFKVLSKLS